MHAKLADILFAVTLDLRGIPVMRKPLSTIIGARRGRKID